MVLCGAEPKLWSMQTRWSKSIILAGMSIEPVVFQHCVSDKYHMAGAFRFVHGYSINCTIVQYEPSGSELS